MDLVKKEESFSGKKNDGYGLKQKDFILKLNESEKANDTHGSYTAWVMSSFSDKGNRLGWTVGFNHEADDALYHLLNNKNYERIFKTADSAIEFLLKTNIVTGACITWC